VTATDDNDVKFTRKLHAGLLRGRPHDT
jgi:hypothetical protein